MKKNYGPYGMHLICRESLYGVHFICRYCPYGVHFNSNSKVHALSGLYPSSLYLVFYLPITLGNKRKKKEKMSGIVHLGPFY